MKYIAYISSLIIVLLCACEEKIDDMVSTQQTDLIVVEGVLTNERINHKIKLTFPYSSQNEQVKPVSGAIITIADGEGNMTTLTENPAGSGEYYTDSLRAVVGKTYYLNIAYQGANYTASDSPPAVQPLDDFSPQPSDENENLYRLNFSESGSLPNYIDYNIRWDDTPFCTSLIDECGGRIIYYDLKTIDVQEFYAPDKIDFYFPKGSQIIRKKHSVSLKYETFLRSLLSETEWRGGVFDIERANVTTNLSEGAIGFFAATTVVSDTSVVN